MATDKQMEANRSNAQNCCGPTSPAGLARSSQNALKSGIYSKAEVTRNESRDEYETLTAVLHARFAPATPDEVLLVDALIRHEWLSRRYMRSDTATWEKRFDQIEEIDVGRVFNDRTEQFTRAGQLFSTSRRGFNSTLKELRQTQAERIKATPAPAATEPRLGSADFVTRGAALKPPQPLQTPKPGLATKPLTPELVSFRVTLHPARPTAPANTITSTPTPPQTPKNPGDDPPIAA